jgi:signal transduction histidine kinase
MKRRLEEIGGLCTWESSPGQGTRVELKVPFPTDLE